MLMVGRMTSEGRMSGRLKWVSNFNHLHNQELYMGLFRVRCWMTPTLTGDYFCFCRYDLNDWLSFKWQGQLVNEPDVSQQMCDLDIKVISLACKLSFVLILMHGIWHEMLNPFTDLLFFWQFEDKELIFYFIFSRGLTSGDSWRQAAMDSLVWAIYPL